MTIEFGICAKKLNEQLKEFNIPKEKTDEWQIIADFIITAHFQHCISDKQSEKLNCLLGKKISNYLKGE